MVANLPDNDQPQLGQVVLKVAGVQLEHFLEYDYTEDFLSPSDTSTFVIDEDELSDRDKNAIVQGARCDVTIGGNTQSVCFIDEIAISSSRHGGTVYHVTLRDWLASAVDGHVDPKTRFTKTMTLLDVINEVLAPFDVIAISTDNVANRNAITGRVYGQKGKKKSLKLFPLGNPAKPMPNEGAFAFCSRIAQRFGLWIWPSIVMGTVIVGVPDFTQPARYSLYHKVSSGPGTRVLGPALIDPSLNNVEDAHVVKSRKDQPTVILASGFGGGGEWPKSKLRGGIINPLIANPETLANPIVSQYPNVKFTTPFVDSTGQVVFTMPPVNRFIPMFEPSARPMYLYDPESHTQEQLDAYLRRELALRMRRALSATYTIEGHTLNGQPVAVDTIVDVDDDRSDLHLPLWVLGRKFSKKPGDGTKTTIEAILPGTLLF